MLDGESLMRRRLGREEAGGGSGMGMGTGMKLVGRLVGRLVSIKLEGGQ